MSNKKKSTGLWRGLTSVSASLLAVTVGASAIVDTNAAFINARLGISSYKIVDTSNGEKTDSTYFKSEFSSLDEVIAAKDALAAEIASEGTVLFKNEDTTLPLNTSSDKVTLWGLNSINPTLGGMIGSSVSIDAEAGQKQYDIQTALTEKGFTLNQEHAHLGAVLLALHEIGRNPLAQALGLTHIDDRPRAVHELVDARRQRQQGHLLLAEGSGGIPFDRNL